MPIDFDNIIIETPFAPQGIPGPPGADGTGVVQADTDGIAPGNIAMVDDLLISDITSVKWLVTIIDKVDGRTLVTELLGVKALVGFVYNRIGTVGDSLQFNLNAFVSGSNINLTVENLDTNAFLVQVVRIPTLV